MIFSSEQCSTNSHFSAMYFLYFSKGSGYNTNSSPLPIHVFKKIETLVQQNCSKILQHESEYCGIPHHTHLHTNTHIRSLATPRHWIDYSNWRDSHHVGYTGKKHLWIIICYILFWEWLRGCVLMLISEIRSPREDYGTKFDKCFVRI